MDRRRLYYLGGLMLIVSAVIDVAGALIFSLALYFPVVPTTAYGILFQFSNVMLLFGIFSFYGSQIEDLGGLGFAAFTLTISGLIFGMSRFFIFQGWIVYYSGLFLFCIADTKVRKYPVAGMWVWFSGSVLAFTALSAGLEPIYGVFVFLACFGKATVGLAIKAEHNP